MLLGMYDPSVATSDELTGPLYGVCLGVCCGVRSGGVPRGFGSLVSAASSMKMPSSFAATPLALSCSATDSEMSASVMLSFGVYSGR